MKKKIPVFFIALMFLFMGVSLFVLMSAENVQASDQLKLPTGFHIIKLGMTYDEIKKILAENQFNKATDPTRWGKKDDYVYFSNKGIEKYEFLREMKYNLKNITRGAVRGAPYIEEWKNFRSIDGDDIQMPNITRGIKFMPSSHADIRDYSCKFPTNKFSINGSDKLISFHVTLYPKYDYGEDFVKSYLNKFIEKYGEPDNNISVYAGGAWRVHGAWHDDDKIIIITSSGAASYSSSDDYDLRIFYKLKNHEKLVTQLNKLQIIGDSMKKKCEEAKRDKVKKSITIE